MNHRETYTGITDNDRSLTIRSLGEAAAEPDETDFTARFRVPGHVHLLKAAPGLLSRREGHAELGVALAEAAGLPPAVVVCEMLDDGTAKRSTPGTPAPTPTSAASSIWWEVPSSTLSSRDRLGRGRPVGSVDSLRTRTYKENRSVGR